ncbi:MAG: hypothetical protein ACRDQU_03395 [Pseudonocardiaceae bacterium]
MTDRRPAVNRLSPMRFVLTFGVVSCLADFVYEGARAIVPAARRGVGYGTFTAAYGLAWLGGGTILGALYDYSIPALITFTIVTQALALLLFVPLLRHR